MTNPGVEVMAGLQPGRSAALAGKVRSASELLGTQERAGVHRTLPVMSALRQLLPGQGLRRGSTIAVRRSTMEARPTTMDGRQVTGEARPGEERPGSGLATGRPHEARPAGRRGAGLALAAQPESPRSAGAQSGGPVVATSLMLALLAEASQAGSWCAVVGVPTLGAAAAAELGIALDRLALVPYPGPEWVNVVAALVDGVDVVVAAPPGPVNAQVASRLTARARQRGCVLVPLISWSGSAASSPGRWAGTDVVLESVRSVWEGLGQGRGRLRRREVTISAYGRGAAARRKQIQVWLPATPDGWIDAEPTGTAGRPTLTVIEGAGGSGPDETVADPIDEAV
jgi:hypothetical protein